MRYAIFSDLHANRQAWAAVRDDIGRLGVDVLVCLGDVVGYGPKPQEVLESVYEVTQNFVLGNHDAVIGGRLDPEIFNDHAREIIEWTREHLDEDARQFFAEGPYTIEGAGFLAVHAEAAQPGRFSYIVEAEDARQSFEATTEPLIFVGHTHHPGRFELSGRRIEKFGSEDFRLEEGKRYVVNTGSVGEPRTPDIHASYCIYDSFQKKIIFRRLPFDIEGYKRDLSEVGLPIRPYFLEVYESGGAMVVHQPAELAMKRAPKIPAAAAHPSRHTRRVVVKQEGEAGGARPFKSAAEAYRAAEAGKVSGKGAALWVTLSLAIVLVAAVGIYALVKNGDEGGGAGAPGSTSGSGATGEQPVVFVGGEPDELPEEISWSDLVVSGYKNLALDAVVTSDGFPAEWGSKGDGAVVDGDPETFLKKVDGKGTYRIGLKFNGRTDISALSLTGMSQHENAPEDFDVYADGRKIWSVTGAVYEDNKLLVPLPKVTASDLELRISKSYKGAPAIRELGVYDWEIEAEEPAVVAVVPEVKPGGDGNPNGTDGGGVTPEKPEEPKTPTAPTAPTAPKLGAAPDPVDPHQPVSGPDQQTFFLPTAAVGSALWHFTTEAPPANWMAPPFKVDGNWKLGESGFGQGRTPESKIRTPWNSKDIWLRTRFEIPNGQLDRSRVWYLSICYDDGCEVYLNGTRIFARTDSVSNYVKAFMPDTVKGLLLQGVNELAVHCTQNEGEQIIDVGVVSAPANSTVAGGNVIEWGPDSLLEEYRNLLVGAKLTRPDNHELLSPGNGETKLADSDPATSWRGKPGRDSYQVQIDLGARKKVNAISLAIEPGSGPEELELKFGNQRLTLSGLSYPNGRQLIRFKSAFTVSNVTMTAKKWQGDSPGIRELGVYFIDPKGKKAPGGGVPSPPTPAPSGSVVRLQEGAGGYEGAADARIAVRMIPGTGQPTRAVNMGGQPRLIVGTLGGQMNRSLLRFDLTDKIPAGAKLGEGLLSFSLVKGAEGAKIDLYLVHPRNGQWVEGTGVSASNQGGKEGATWVTPNAAGRDSWFGGDGLGEPGPSGGYLSLKGATKPIGSGAVDSKNKRIQFKIPSEVMQLWADRPETNTGLLLRIPVEDPESDQQISVHSGESAEVGLRPQLEIKIVK